jgi:hypothetical protein
MGTTDEYATYVMHPRYGQGPRVTGLNPQTDYAGKVILHWHSPLECRIANTAIRADLSKQTEATVPVTYYYDVKRQCRDCGRPFIFFAAEQQYWYEELGFGLDSDCVRCVPCRKQRQGHALLQERYAELFHVQDRTVQQTLEMADCCLSLIEQAVFNHKQKQHVANLLNQIEFNNEQGIVTRAKKLRERLNAIDE